MKSKIRVLAILPYAEMEPVLNSVAHTRPELELTVFVGDLQQGVEIAQRNFHANYDAILSRGGTAKLIQQAVSLPVIEIKTGALDIMRTLALAGFGRRTAIVGFANITGQLVALQNVLPKPVEVFTINSAEEARQVLRHVCTLEYEAVLCDAVTSTLAREFGIDPFLIASGPESIAEALETIALFFTSAGTMQQENSFLRGLLHGGGRETLVFTAAGQLFFSTIKAEGSYPIIDLLRTSLHEIPKAGKRRLVYRLEGLQYIVYCEQVQAMGGEYLVFQFTCHRPPVSASLHGIRQSNHTQVQQEYLNSAQEIASHIPEVQQSLLAGQTTRPVVFVGEYGTGKEQAAKLFYMQSHNRAQPFVHIDCTLLSEKSWQYLLENSHSPFYDRDNTVYIQNLDALTATQHSALIATIIQSELAKRNQVIFSCLADEEGNAHPAVMHYINRLGCAIVALPPLRRLPHRIESLANLYRNRACSQTGLPVTGFSSEAIALLQSYSWPQNVLQFRRVLDSLMQQATEPVIGAQAVKSILEGEIAVAPAAGHGGNIQPLDLQRPLAEINRDVARMVLEACNDNHSATAKTLGISRTTLWRLLKE